MSLDDATLERATWIVAIAMFLVCIGELCYRVVLFTMGPNPTRWQKVRSFIVAVGILPATAKFIFDTAKREQMQKEGINQSSADQHSEHKPTPPTVPIHRPNSS